MRARPSMRVRCAMSLKSLDIDQIDRKIVAQLREDARRSFREVGVVVGLSAPAVKRRVDRLVERGIVTGTTAMIDAERLGWSTRAIVALFCDGRMTAAEVRAAVSSHPQ